MGQPSKIAIVSASPSPTSRSRAAARSCAETLQELGLEVDFLDLRELELPPYPRGADDLKLQDFCARFNACHGWVFATPTYNFGPSGTMLTFLHYALDTDAGERYRPFTVVMSLAGLRSAMAGDSLARTIIHERGSIQVGPAILITGADVEGESGAIVDHAARRISGSMRALAHFVEAYRRLPTIA